MLVKSISEEVIAAIRQDRGIQTGVPRKIADLVEAKILPHFDFRHATQLAMGVNWRRATPEQQEQLTWPPPTAVLSPRKCATKASKG